MKKMIILAAGVMLSASAVQAQSGNSSDATVSATISGIYAPNLNLQGTSITLTAPASAPFTIPFASAPAPSQVSTAARGLPLSTEQVSTINRSVATLASNTTAGEAVPALNALIVVLKSMQAGAQYTFLSSPAGTQILHLMLGSMAVLQQRSSN